jgi:cytochrome c oxidase subunit 2
LVVGDLCFGLVKRWDNVTDKWWSFLFGTVMVACTALFVVAPLVGWWLPKAVSSHAWDIDFLFYLILAITGFFFILTEGLLVAFMFRYSERPPGQVLAPSPLAKVFEPLTRLFNTSHKIEMAWSIVPSIILLYLAFAQVSTWADVKYKSRLQQVPGYGTAVLDNQAAIPLQVAVSARQFEWRMRYPSPATWKKWKKDGKVDEGWARKAEFDDIHIVNDLHIIKGQHVVVQLSTKDVIHSFNSPHMRVKQDALPGKTIPVWFKPIASNVTAVKDDKGKIIDWQDGGGHDPETGKPRDPSQVWQIACAELCGWGHYRMIGRLFVHETEQDFYEWLEHAAAQQNNFGGSSAGEK